MNYSNSKWRKIYWSFPPFLQNFGTSIYGRRLNSRVFSDYYHECYNFLERSQWFSSEELQQYQNDQLINFLKYAVKTVPYYRDIFAEYGLSAKDICAANDLQKFPLLDKETVRLNADHLVADPFRDNKSQIVNVHTSGTTGTGLHLKLSKEAYQQEYAFRYLHISWAGVTTKMKMAFFAGHPVTPPNRLTPPFWTEDKWNKSIYFSSLHIATATLPSYISQIRKFQPDLVRGYPSAIYLIALGLLEYGEKNVCPKAVFTNSETLLDRQRTVIEKAFSCKVYDWYGNAEQVGNIVECEQGNLHVKAEHSYIEFLRPDGALGMPGEVCEMVCTGFGNYAMPLIRYRVGDMAVLSDCVCPCGRNGSIVGKIIGRVEDVVVTPDGRHVGRLDHLFKDMLNVKEAQIVQDTVDSLKIRIVKREGFGGNDMRLLKEEVHLRLGENLKIQFEFVDKLKRDSSGKLRFVISRVPKAIHEFYQQIDAF